MTSLFSQCYVYFKLDNHVEGGVVTLNGFVGYFEEDNLVSSIKGVYGIVRIISNSDVVVE
jgi:hypothetical protein